VTGIVGGGRRRFAAGLVVALVWSAWATAQDKPTFVSKIEAVRVDVLVTDHGQPVPGLGAADFEVLDNGVRQHVTLAGVERMPINVTLALDASNSVAGDRLSQLRAASRALLGGLESQDQAALVTFNHRVSLASSLTPDLDLVRGALQRLRTSGGTALLDAIFAGIVVGESDVGRGLLVVFTDGADTSSLLTHDAVLDVARRTDIVAYAAVVGLWGRRSTLSDIVAQTGGSVFEIESVGDLPPVFLKILQEFRQRYVLSYVPTGVGQGGWHRIDVRVTRRPVSIKARLGYQAGG
jgi:VWFA-related protein